MVYRRGFLLSRRMLAGGGMGKRAVRGLWVGAGLAGGRWLGQHVV